MTVRELANILLRGDLEAQVHVEVRPSLQRTPIRPEDALYGHALDVQYVNGVVVIRNWKIEPVEDDDEDQ